MRPIEAEILIAAPPESVFEVILDTDAYPDWNPFTPRITLASQEVAVGREFDLDCRMSEKELLRDEHEVVLELDREKLAFCMGTSRTRGRPGIRSFRWQRCLPAPGGETRFTNAESFHGPIAPFVQLLYARKLERAFRRYCEALKRRVESRLP